MKTEKDTAKKRDATIMGVVCVGLITFWSMSLACRHDYEGAVAVWLLSVFAVLDIRKGLLLDEVIHTAQRGVDLAERLSNTNTRLLDLNERLSNELRVAKKD